MINYIWRFNRWFDGLNKTQPVLRFVILFATIIGLLTISVVFTAIMGYYLFWIDPACTLILMLLCVMRFAWLRKNKVI